MKKSSPGRISVGRLVRVLIDGLVVSFKVASVKRGRMHSRGQSVGASANELVMAARLPGGLELQGPWPSPNRRRNGNREALTHVLQMGEEGALQGRSWREGGGGAREAGASAGAGTAGAAGRRAGRAS